MFYSRYFLSRKGPLGAIWVAAHCFKRLKKAQVFETNIPFSVDDILENEFDVMTYRVLAYLLLGLVRIYSKKVEYLFDDCHDVMIKINNFLVSDKSKENLESRCAPYYSITLPDSFELDAFDLEILEDFSSENVVPCQAITLKDDASTARGKGHYSMEKYYFEDFASCHCICSADYSPAEDIFSSHLMEIGMTVSAPHDFSKLEISLENIQSNSFAQKQRVNNDIFCGIEREAAEPIEPFGEDHQTEEEHMKIPATSQSENDVDMEKLRDDRFRGVEEEPLDSINNIYREDHQSNGEQIKVSDLEQLENETCQATIKDDNKNVTNLQASTEKLLDHIVPEVSTGVEMFYGSEEEPPKQVELSVEERHTDTEPMKFMETSSQNSKCKSMKREVPLSVSVDAIPQFMFPDASGATTPEFMVVRTPATKERARILRKRKCCFDDVTVFPNDVIKQCIQNASDLVSKRRKVPHTVLAAWKASRISNLSQGFLVSLLPCISLELRSFLCQEKLKVPVAKSSELLEPEFPTVHISLEQMAIAPETPISRSSQNMSITPDTPTCIFLEKMAVAPHTPTCRSSEQMGVAPDTPTCRSSEKMAVAPDTPTGGSCEKMAVAPDTPTGGSSENMAGRSSENMLGAPDMPTGKSSEQIAVNIKTHIFHSMASTSFETSDRRENARLIEAETLAHSYLAVKEPASSKDEDFDLIFMNEESNASDADEQELHGLSARTRMLARYLHKRFLFCKKIGKDEAVKLLLLLEGKSKKESARIFYEVLVLQTKGMVVVKQDDAYGDILIQKAPQSDLSCL